MENRCGCCEGTEVATPEETANRPGLSALVYRMGTHATFLETMKARLSNLALEIPRPDEPGAAATDKLYPLQDLKTREGSDPAIALLDAWAMVGDVLTFYQERIANEGYLRTATERRSILELARLVGYRLRPGVASSVYLAYTLDDKSEPLEIPAGARAQSVPGPGELPQSFETSEVLLARKEWNNLKPRVTRPQSITAQNAEFIRTIYFAGTETNLKVNDLLLFAFEGADRKTVLRKVESVEPQFSDQRTKVMLQLSMELETFKKAVRQLIVQNSNPAILCVPQDKLASDVFQQLSALGAALNAEAEFPKIVNAVKETLAGLRNLEAEADEAGNAEAHKWIGELIRVLGKYLHELRDPTSGRRQRVSPTVPVSLKPQNAFASFIKLAAPLSRPVSLQPANSLRLERDVENAFAPQRDIMPQMLAAFNPRLGANAYRAWANTTVTAPPPVEVYAMRVTASLFGNNAPRRILRIEPGTGKILETGEWPVVEFEDHTVLKATHEKEAVIDLDGSFDKILPDSWVVVDTSEVDVDGDETNVRQREGLFVTKADNVSAPMSRADYGFSGKITRLNLAAPWIRFKPNEELQRLPEGDFQFIRHTRVYAQSELLALAEEPIGEDVCGDQVEMGQLYDGLKSGRWVIVSGERTDIPGTSGITARELVMLADVEQSFDPELPGDKVHSTLILAAKLAYTYKRDTVIIYGNVVKATHGETRNEVLGGGDASQAMQQFTLKQPPLTYVSAPTTEGISSTLHVYVNEVEWHETDSLAGLAPDERKFITLTDDEAKTTVIFGNGREGARLPTGVENVLAVYRNGIGKAGNAKAEQISLLATRPLGVKEVINPLRATGGADKESRDQARRNAPLAVMSLDRLVSTQDYADFARTFAGIGKASAVRLSDGHRRLVHLTIAGADDIPIDERSDLYINLRQALGKFGDPFQAVQVDVRELVALVISANVRLLPDYQWEKVEPKIRARLLSRFSFDERELGQPVFLSEVISTVQQVAGVAYVDVDVLDSISESEVVNPKALEEKLKPAEDETAAPPATGEPGTAEKAPIKQPRKYIRVELAQTAAQNRERATLSPDKAILPAQLAILLPSVPDTLILNPVKEVKP